MRTPLAALILITSLGGCVAYGPAPGPYGAYPAAGPADVYYDGYYGAIVGGYWGPDHVFYYDRGDHRYVRDVSGHFRPNPVRGYNHLRVNAARRIDDRQDHR